MLQITQAQWQALAQLDFERSIQKLEAALLAVPVPQVAEMEPTPRREWVREGVRLAQQYGLEEERHITLFLSWRAEYGDGFPEDRPAVEEVLGRADVEVEQRLEQVDELLLFGE